MVNGTVSPASTVNSPMVVISSVPRSATGVMNWIALGPATATAPKMLAYPRNAASVIEAQDDLGVHPHPARLAVDQADQIDLIFSFLRQGHEIDDFGIAFWRLEVGL